MQNEFQFDIIDRVVLFSMRHRDQIVEEFNNLINFYRQNNNRLFDDMLSVKSMLTPGDHYSDMASKGADSILNNSGKLSTGINETYLLDSHTKIYQQIRVIPDDVKLVDPMAKIFFYDLLPEPAATGSRLILSTLILEWREYSARYFALVN